MRARTEVSRIINASPAKVYRAFVDRSALVAWLPPGEMTGVVHAFEPRNGGAFSMSLIYPPGEAAGRGKTTLRTDKFQGRFAELVPDERIVWAVAFVSVDASFAGEMKVTTTLMPVADGTKVTMVCEDIPPGISADDNEAGCRASLEKLARFLEG